jgi:hypothetical protein
MVSVPRHVIWQSRWHRSSVLPKYWRSTASIRSMGVGPDGSGFLSLV